MLSITNLVNNRCLSLCWLDCCQLRPRRLLTSIVADMICNECIGVYRPIVGIVATVGVIGAVVIATVGAILFLSSVSSNDGRSEVFC